MDAKPNTKVQIYEEFNTNLRAIPWVFTTDYRCECVSKKARFHAGQYFTWIEGFTTNKKRIGIG
jgi:hypothetical protein